MTDGPQGVEASSHWSQASEMPMVKEDVVEAAMRALSRGEPVLGVARAYGLDPKTVRVATTWALSGSPSP